MQIYIFPGCMLVVEAAHSRARILGDGIGKNRTNHLDDGTTPVLMAATPAILYDTKLSMNNSNTELEWNDATNALARLQNSDMREDETAHLKYVPTDPQAMHRHGMALILFGGIISIVGTGTYIYSSIVV